MITVRSVTRTLVPRPLRRRLRNLVRPAAPPKKKYRLDLPYAERFPARHDVSCFDIGPDLMLAVFWKDLPIGRGPAFSVHAGAVEPLKFDCFGEGGYFHTATKPFGEHKEDRIWLPEPTRKAQVDRALFEIEQNADYYLARTPTLAGKLVRIDPEKTAQACRDARKLAYHFIDTVPQLQDMPQNRPA
jgi:hypothetical protein